ncbi:PQ loop repeat-domain-containing protein [Pilobolus umbonatus]|nr:PQ loop repeat-domain-containing protein [Pilobolus umbonatus]
MDSIGPVVSTIIGWTYFIAWSSSFYPQFILNYRTKSVQGLSIDFLYYNVYGFICYSIFNLSFYYSESIKEEYKERYDNKDNLVRSNDVFFAVHAMFISMLTLSQTFYYQRHPSQRLSNIAKYFIAITFTGILMMVYGILFQVNIGRRLLWIDLMYYLSYIKLAVSLIKYVPQAYLNFRRKSTVGWSIQNILLDFTGGVLSIIQLILDAFLSGDWSGISGDPVKFGLGFQSIAFDILFMLQHFVFYRNHKHAYLNTVDEERRRLIGEGLVTDEEIGSYSS